jgi:hypothetical protein
MAVHLLQLALSVVLAYCIWVLLDGGKRHGCDRCARCRAARPTQ